MIYHVELRLTTTGSITKLIPAKSAIRVQLKMIKEPTDQLGVKKRMLIGWQTQKQLDALIKHCGLAVTPIDVHSVHQMELGWLPKIVMQAGEYHATVIPFPQKYKRATSVFRKPDMMYVHRRQTKRLIKAFVSKYSTNLD